jgi:hypothetical protein
MKVRDNYVLFRSSRKIGISIDYKFKVPYNLTSCSSIMLSHKKV